MYLGEKITLTAVAVLLAAAFLATSAHAQGNATASTIPKTTTQGSVTQSNESVHTVGVHHYQSSDEEAQDAMLITAVKTALATDGVANGHPVEVDCDHGVARLSGVVGSSEDAKHAAQVAANVPGVVGVQNQLTWR